MTSTFPQPFEMVEQLVAKFGTVFHASAISGVSRSALNKIKDERRSFADVQAETIGKLVKALML